MDCTVSLGPFQIPQTVDFTKGIHVPLEDLPKQYIDGRIVVNKERRCILEYGKKENKGGYAHITKVRRTPPVGADLCVKSPINTSYSLTAEAVLQVYASNTLRLAGIHGAIPHVYDIFQYAGETRFTMEFIHGMSAIEAVARAADPDSLWLKILVQVSLLLGYLEEWIHLDHRDLKADNLWIRNRPVDYFLTVGGVKWLVQAPFQVVILDYGFACLGSGEGNAIVSLSDGILPVVDPCPKEGRDLFQLVASMWSIPAIRERAGKEVRAAMEELLTNGGASYGDLVKKGFKTHWIYLAVSDSKFRHPPLHPMALLLKLSSEWKNVGLQRL